VHVLLFSCRLHISINDIPCKSKVLSTRTITTHLLTLSYAAVPCSYGYTHAPHPQQTLRHCHASHPTLELQAAAEQQQDLALHPAAQGSAVLLLPAVLQLA
jgi:hypothetical protein